MTPASFYAYTAGYLGQEKTAREADIEIQNAMVYHLASLVRVAVWGKRMPKMQPVFKKERRQMTDEEMYKNVCALAKALGGEIREVE